MNTRTWFFIPLYFLVFLGGARLLAGFSESETLPFWLAFAGAALVSATLSRNKQDFWLLPLAYVLLFSFDYLLGYRLITSAKTESLITGIFAAIIFILPLMFGRGARFAVSRMRRN